MKKSFTFATFLLVGMLWLSVAKAQEPIKIGAINPYSGPLAQFGVEVTRGYELAVDTVNTKGGILGRKVVLIRGDAGNPQQGISIVGKLVEQDKVDLFIGTYLSAVANSASDAAARYRKIYWDTHALSADLTERGLSNFIRGGPNAIHFADTSVKGAFELIAPKLNKKPDQLKVWIEHEDSAYGTSIAQVQKKLFEAAGTKVVGMGSHNFRAIDLTDAILRARSAAPDIFVSTGYVPDGILLLRTMRDQGFVPPAIMMQGTGDGGEFFEALGGFMDGIFVVGYPHADLAPSFAPGAASFLKDYRQKYGREPIAPQSLEAYSVAMILFDVIAAAGGTDMDKMVAAAVALDKPVHTYPNGFGAKFDSKMQNIRANPNITQWQKGRTVTVYPKNAAAPDTSLINVPRAK